jgi:L-lactate utilization protein LutB
MNRFKKTDFQNQRQVQYEDATIDEPTAVKTEVKDGKKVTRHIDWKEVKKDNRELQRKTFDDLENAVSGANSKLTGTGVHIGAMTPIVMNE